MSVGGWVSDNNVIVSICAAIGGIVSAWLAGRIKRAISHDAMLIKGYDQFTGRLAVRVEALEKELDRREKECRERLNDADLRFDETEQRLRACEADRTILRKRIDDLDRRISSP